MANMHDCLGQAMDGGELDRVRGEATQQQYDQLVARYEKIMPRPAAEAAAARDVKEALRTRLPSRQHKVIAQLQAMRRMKELIDTSDDPALALRNLIERSDGSGYRGESIRSLAEGYVSSINAGIQEFLRTSGRTMTGRSRDPAMLENVVRELHAEDTGDVVAKELAEAIRSEQNRMRGLFNAHGGDIGKLDDYGAPHSHDAGEMRKKGEDAWIDTVFDELDWSRIVNFDTGKPFVATKGELPDRAVAARFLDEVYDGIITRGWNKRDPSMSVGGRALYNQRAEHRVLHFRDGSAWLRYNKAFGTSDPFSALVGGLHGLGHDVAQMRVLGPNPKMGLEYATQVARKRAEMQGDAKLVERVQTMGQRAATMLSHFDGSVNVPEGRWSARFLGTTRKVLTAAQLGSATLSAVTDLATMRMAAKTVGMNPGNLMSQQVQLATSAATRATAARMGHVADTLADMGSAQARFTGETFTSEVADRISGFVMRASLLSQWTDLNRGAFKMEFSGYLAENADRALDQIDAPLRRIFEDRGITAEDWDRLRDPAAMFTAPNGATFISPHWWRNHTAMPIDEAEGLAQRLQMIVEEQMEFAVPTSSLEGRAMLIGNSRPGTFAGEILRSTAMYKSFAMSLTINQVRRWQNIETPMGRAAYAAQMSAGLILLGAVAVQLKEVAKGRDPRPMDDTKFAMAALFQGGGLGIFGDFFASETSRAGGGIYETVGGPVVGFGSDVIGLFAENAVSAAEGRDLRLGRDVTNFIRYNTPVLSSLWYERLAFDRLVADQLQDLIDPEAEAQWRRQERQRERDYGNTPWWSRGEITPDRAPDLSNILPGDAP